ncbi:hypothetical protein G3O07_16100 [Pseudomonas laurentiana]|uniref:Uncharacterized protein n=1 Tax=Pseudomonas laurentiana TaxID=2364649 RepID=A0A6I5RT44_9PSED|nr:hypothetical protein [Pseudomonas laurentiana]
MTDIGLSGGLDFGDAQVPAMQVQVPGCIPQALHQLLLVAGCPIPQGILEIASPFAQVDRVVLDHVLQAGRCHVSLHVALPAGFLHRDVGQLLTGPVLQFVDTARVNRSAYDRRRALPAIPVYPTKAFGCAVIHGVDYHHAPLTLNAFLTAYQQLLIICFEHAGFAGAASASCR